jgi:protoporphyrinogen IX oxidase
MSSSYLWVKAFHIVFVASWFAGLFCLPGLFANLALVAADSAAERERLRLMARKLDRFSGLQMVPAIALGIVLWLGYGAGRDPGNDWLLTTLGVALAAIGYHHGYHGCRRLLHGFATGANRRSDGWLRVFNELSVLLFAAVVALAVVKPF